MVSKVQNQSWHLAHYFYMKLTLMSRSAWESQGLTYPPSASFCVSDPNSYWTFSISPPCSSNSHCVHQWGPTCYGAFACYPWSRPTPVPPFPLSLLALGRNFHSFPYFLILISHSMALPLGSYSSLSVGWNFQYMMSTFAPDSGLCLWLQAT